MAAAAFDRDQGRGWQVGKPLAACLKYMLDKEIVCDVTFKIHNPEGCYSRVSAHKMILQARSPVFEAMFSGDFVEAGKDVVIADAEVESFKEMLRYLIKNIKNVLSLDNSAFACYVSDYIDGFKVCNGLHRYLYTDEVVITGENVVHLLYASKKYTLEDLSDKCERYLRKRITVDNVCSILTHSLVYQYDDLVKPCMDVIEPNAKTIARTTGFYNMSHDALFKIVSNDNLANGAEVDLFQGCLQWAKHKAEIKKSASGEELRELLGECLYKIRFPFIAAEDFAAKFSMTTVLTGEEKAHIYALHLTKDEFHSVALASLGFDVTSRMHIVQRFTETLPRNFELDVSGGAVEDFSLTPTKRVLLRGFSLHSGAPGSKHNVNMRVLNAMDGDAISEVETTIEYTGNSQLIPVYTKKISLEPNVQYRVCVSMKGRKKVGYGIDALTTLNIWDCSFACRTHHAPQLLVFPAERNSRGWFAIPTAEARGYVGEILLQTFNC